METAAIVTAASRGIGLETAKALALMGYLICDISRTSPQFSHVLFAHKACDISDSETLGLCMDSIIADAQARGATIDTLVNSAGYAQPGAWGGRASRDGAEAIRDQRLWPA